MDCDLSETSGQMSNVLVAIYKDYEEIPPEVLQEVQAFVDYVTQLEKEK